MATLIEVAFTGKMADDTTKAMGMLFAKDNTPLSIRQLRLKLRTTESSVTHSITRLQHDFEVLRDGMDYKDRRKVGNMVRVENKFSVKGEYIEEVKALFLRKEVSVKA